jgi:hypothetical protein
MDQKVRYEIEFPINSSPQLLYQVHIDSIRLSEWFRSNVNSRGEYFTFVGMIQRKRPDLPQKKRVKKLKFKWVGKDSKGYGYFFLITHIGR